MPFSHLEKKEARMAWFPLGTGHQPPLGSAWRVHDSPPLPTMMAPAGCPFLHPLLPRPTAALTSTTCGIPPVLKPIQKKALGSVYLGCSQPLRSPSIASLNHLWLPEWTHTHTEKGLCLTLYGWCPHLGGVGRHVCNPRYHSVTLHGRCTT